MVNLNDELYKEVSEFVDNNEVDYPTIQNFVNKAVKDKLKKRG